MGTKDPRIDAYIAKSGDFAKPIIKRLRVLLHKGCPGVVETIKWSHATFDYPAGSIFCGVAAFKQHCAVAFWKEKLLRADADAARVLDAIGRMESENELPSDAALLKVIKQATKLSDEGVKVPRSRKPPKKPLPMPKDFATALKKSKSAAANFESFSPSKKRDYLEWIIEAKADDTRQRRIATAVEWIAEGKARNWKYERN